MVTLHMIVYGRVQGVGFRYYTRQTAEKLGVKGWVKNKPDGTVEIIAQSDKTTLQKFTTAIKAGSPPSRVKKVHLEEVQEETKKYQTFQISY